MMGGTGLAPAVAEVAGPAGKAGAHVGIAEGEDGSGLVDALGRDELEVSVPILGDAEIGDRALGGIELGQVAAAGLAVEDRDDLHGRLLCFRDVRIAGAGVTDDADVFVKVDGVHLAELAHAGDRLQDGHGHGDLDVALDGTGGPLLDEHREGRDQHAVQLAGNTLGKAVIVACDEAELLVPDPALEGHNIFRHIPYLFDRAAAFDVEGVEDILRLCAYRLFVGDIVGDRPHFFPVKLLGVEPHAVVKVGLIDVQIHHAGIRPADLGEVCVAEAAAHLSGAAPVGDLGIRLRVSALDNPRDDGMTLSGTLEVGHHLAHGAAGIELAQPGCGIGVGIVRGFLLLEVDQYHGYVQIPHSRQHVVAGGIGQQLEDHEVDVGRAEFVAGLHGLFLGGDKAAVNELNRVGNALFELRVLALKLGNQRRKLGQIGAQCDGEHADAGFGAD